MPAQVVEIFTITEGPTDVIVLRAVLDALGARYTLAMLQPESDGLSGPVRSSVEGFGWRDGVRAYCQTEREAIDFVRARGVVIIHLDADVARKNLADFDRDLRRPCPPARHTCDEVRREILGWLGATATPEGVVLCVPAQATEAWVLAALDPAFLTQIFNSARSRATNQEKAELDAIGPEAHFECCDSLALSRVGMDKRPEAFETRREELAQRWAQARSLPEAARFEAELLVALQLRGAHAAAALVDGEREEETTDGG